MKDENKSNEMFRTSHIVILLCYTLFSVILIGETCLLGWEKWALILIGIGVIISWFIHIRQNIAESIRLWIYSVLMMATFFFYGTHTTSTFDLCAVMTGLLMIYTMTGVEAMTYLCQGTYLLTFFYGIVELFRSGHSFDSIDVTRSILHVSLIFIAGWVARVIMDRWRMVLKNVSDESAEFKGQIERLNDFLANISHEIRTPVNVITGLSDSLLDDENNEEKQDNIRAVSSAGRKIGELIGDILDYSEVDMGSLAVNSEDYMISSLLSDIVAEIRPRLTDDIELVIDVDPEIPSVMNTDVVKLKKILLHLIANSIKYTNEGGVYVHITPERREYGINLFIEVVDTGIGMSEYEIERVIDRFYQADSGRTRAAGGLGLGLPIVAGFVKSLNGFLNIESTPGKGTCVRVSIPQKIVDKEDCMSLDHSDKLSLGAYLHFEKYPNPKVRQFYDAMTKDMVLGLGAMMQRANNIDNFKRIAEATHFTHVFVGKEEYEEDVDFMEELARETYVAVVADESFMPRKGSRVSIMRKPFYCFPVISFLNTDRDTEKEEGRLYARGVKALVVDDEPMNHMVAKQILSRYGMEVYTASSGNEAIEMVSDIKLDIVFMDHMMPGMDGVEAMKRIRSFLGKTGKELPIVALTANAVSTAKEKFLSEGFDGFIPKPIEIPELEHVLKKVLSKSSITIEHEQEEESYSDAQMTKVLEFEPDDIEEVISEVTKNNNLLDKLEEMGVDTKTGLSYCQDDISLYEEILLEYGRDSKDKYDKLEKYLSENDLKNYGIIIHAVKSTSKMIGANKVSDNAKKLEDASGRGDRAMIDSLHAGTMEQYKKLANVLREHFDKGGEKENNPLKPAVVVMEFEPDMGE